MYVYYNPNPQKNYRAGDCVIRAISIATGDTWNNVYDDLCKEGKYFGDWGNNNGVWDTYLRKRGYKRYICPNNCPFCYSIKDFAKEHSYGTYIVATGSHVVAIIDGDYIDSWNSGNEIPIYYYKIAN